MEKSGSQTFSSTLGQYMQNHTEVCHFYEWQLVTNWVTIMHNSLYLNQTINYIRRSWSFEIFLPHLYVTSEAENNSANYLGLFLINQCVYCKCIYITKTLGRIFNINITIIITTLWRHFVNFIKVASWCRD